MKSLHFAPLLGLSPPGACALATEEPTFTISLSEGGFEVRHYAALSVAEVSVTGEPRMQRATGFAAAPALFSAATLQAEDRHDSAGHAGIGGWPEAALHRKDTGTLPNSGRGILRSTLTEQGPESADDQAEPCGRLADLANAGVAEPWRQVSTMSRNAAGSLKMMLR